MPFICAKWSRTGSRSRQWPLETRFISADCHFFIFSSPVNFFVSAIHRKFERRKIHFAFLPPVPWVLCVFYFYAQHLQPVVYPPLFTLLALHWSSSWSLNFVSFLLSFVQILLMLSSQIRKGAPCKPLTWPLPAEFMSRYRMQCVNNNFFKKLRRW